MATERDKPRNKYVNTSESSESNSIAGAAQESGLYVTVEKSMIIVISDDLSLHQL